MRVLEIEGLCFAYGKKLIYDDFSLHVDQGEIVALVGPSGVGKSTLFELIAGFLQPQKGIITKKRFSLIFQDPYTSFHPSYTILNQIEDVADTQGIEEVAKRMDIDPQLLKKLPHELSGGQLQRCSILRAMMMQPQLLLADEPTSALDNITSLKVMKLLLEYLDEVGILLITHDIALAKWCADRIIELQPQSS
ncbi:ABC transporter ATP-binding protein [Nitratiruptor sp. YY09-18]|uniref:ABC transporter ATP-binding protein n=1 Tax=Nitratiruptor sp. YY09-18 TaxID=2724901 RepID=UPI00191610C8|nr:ATP-binding cassette domain-containing protein [Nitratiruptor sp. YY09-18]BCD68197.1 peptide/nickel transport system ATP-binding protein [Nitratiruptor sp. YY09-18]